MIVFSLDRPACKAFPLPESGSLVFGRQCPDGVSVDDMRASRRHVEVKLGDAGWAVRDLGSTNGTRVDGQNIVGEVRCERAPVVRFGRTLLVALPDVRHLISPGPMRSERLVLGPSWRATLAEVEAVAASGSDLLVVGEPGSGKAEAAAHFHVHGPRAGGPFVPVHCAAIPAAVAERMFFGSARSTVGESGAPTSGYLHTAAGGVLFLAEVDRLSPAVLAKVLGLTRSAGASAPPRADVAFCFSSDRDIEPHSGDEPDADLVRRHLMRSVVRLPPLRDRCEEIPWLAALALEGQDPRSTLAADLVEACLLRRWSGNVRELMEEVRRIARVAQSQSRDVLRSDLLAPDPDAGLDGAASSRKRPVTVDQIRRALREAPSVTGAAQMLRIHRSHLYRLIRRYGIELKDFPSLKV